MKMSDKQAPLPNGTTNGVVNGVSTAVKPMTVKIPPFASGDDEVPVRPKRIGRGGKYYEVVFVGGKPMERRIQSSEDLTKSQDTQQGPARNNAEEKPLSRSATTGSFVLEPPDNLMVFSANNHLEPTPSVRRRKSKSVETQIVTPVKISTSGIPEENGSEDDVSESSQSSSSVLSAPKVNGTHMGSKNSDSILNRLPFKSDFAIRAQQEIVERMQREEEIRKEQEAKRQLEVKKQLEQQELMRAEERKREKEIQLEQERQRQIELEKHREQQRLLEIQRQQERERDKKREEEIKKQLEVQREMSVQRHKDMQKEFEAQKEVGMREMREREMEIQKLQQQERMLAVKKQLEQESMILEKKLQADEEARRQIEIKRKEERERKEEELKQEQEKQRKIEEAIKNEEKRRRAEQMWKDEMEAARKRDAEEMIKREEQKRILEQEAERKMKEELRAREEQEQKRLEELRRKQEVIRQQEQYREVLAQQEMKKMQEQQKQLQLQQELKRQQERREEHMRQMGQKDVFRQQEMARQKEIAKQQEAKRLLEQQQEMELKKAQDLKRQREEEAFKEEMRQQELKWKEDQKLKKQAAKEEEMRRAEGKKESGQRTPKLSKKKNVDRDDVSDTTSEELDIYDDVQKTKGPKIIRKITGLFHKKGETPEATSNLTGEETKSECDTLNVPPSPKDQPSPTKKSKLGQFFSFKHKGGNSDRESSAAPSEGSSSSKPPHSAGATAASWKDQTPDINENSLQNRRDSLDPPAFKLNDPPKKNLISRLKVSEIPPFKPKDKQQPAQTINQDRREASAGPSVRSEAPSFSGKVSNASGPSVQPKPLSQEPPTVEQKPPERKQFVDLLNIDPVEEAQTSPYALCRNRGSVRKDRRRSRQDEPVREGEYGTGYTPITTVAISEERLDQVPIHEPAASQNATRSGNSQKFTQPQAPQPSHERPSQWKQNATQSEGYSKPTTSESYFQPPPTFTGPSTSAGATSSTQQPQSNVPPESSERRRSSIGASANLNESMFSFREGIRNIVAMVSAWLMASINNVPVVLWHEIRILFTILFAMFIALYLRGFVKVDERILQNILRGVGRLLRNIVGTVLSGGIALYECLDNLVSDSTVLSDSITDV